MDAAINASKKISNEIISLLDKQKKKKYIGNLIKNSLEHISKLFKNLGEEEDFLLFLRENLEEILTKLETLVNSKFFKSFGNYFENQDTINQLISSINKLIDYINDNMNEKIPNISLDSFSYKLIDQTIKEINSNNLPLPKTKIKNEFTYIFLGLEFDNEEEKNEEEENKSNFKDFFIKKKQFKCQSKKLVKKFDLDKKIISEENVENMLNSFKKPSKISLEELEDFFSEKFILCPSKSLRLTLLESKTIESISMKLNYDSYKRDDGQVIPLKTPGIMLFGRKAKANANEIDFFLGEEATISRTQFEIALDDKLQETHIKCYSESNHTNFLINDNKFYLELYHLITFGDDHTFYVRESHNFPIENSLIPYKGGAYLVIKGIGSDSEYLGKKILIKNKACKVDEKKDNFHKIFTLDKKETVIIGENLKFKDKNIDQNHAHIGYDPKKDQWFIKSGYNEQAFFKKHQTKIDVVKFNDTKNYNCKPVLLKSGNIINIGDYSFEFHDLN